MSNGWSINATPKNRQLEFVADIPVAFQNKPLLRCSSFMTFWYEWHDKLYLHDHREVYILRSEWREHHFLQQSKRHLVSDLGARTPVALQRFHSDTTRTSKRLKENLPAWTQKLLRCREMRLVEWGLIGSSQGTLATVADCITSAAHVSWTRDGPYLHGAMFYHMSPLCCQYIWFILVANSWLETQAERWLNFGNYCTWKLDCRGEFYCHL